MERERESNRASESKSANGERKRERERERELAARVAQDIGAYSQLQRGDPLPALRRPWPLAGHLQPAQRLA